MAALDANGAATGSLVAAAMESAGIEIQSQMLAWVQGDSGMILAGLLFLIGIISGVFSVASGGNFIWSRYLLIGPALFLFLTQTTSQVNGSQWRFHDHEFSQAEVQRALTETGYTGRGDVSLFFHFWNNFTTSATQELMGLLNLTSDGSHLDFLTKVDRYLQVWLNSNIPDPRLNQFIRLIMMNECAGYYSMLMAIADPDVDPVQKTEYRRRIALMADSPRYTSGDGAVGPEWERTLITEGKLQPETTYTCDDLWTLAISLLQEPAAEQLQKILERNLNADQTLAQATEKLVRKMGVQKNRATGQVSIEEGQVLHAVHWLMLRGLWGEMTESNAMREYYNREGHGAFHASGVQYGAMPVQNSGTNTASSIRQFNYTETYQFKGDFINAAMSMPYFQGVGLLVLAATFPFFAMAMVMPGKASTILMWMGLWTWLKLWDLGFAVVMMIDNILYTMFPKGPALTAEDMQSPGAAFMKLLEQDPSYSSALYYNIIAVCLFAVPIITGLFVKGSGGAVVGMLRDAWQAHSNRLAGSAVSYARALQGQGYVKQQRMNEAYNVARDMAALENSEQFQNDLKNFAAVSFLSGAVGEGGSKLKGLSEDMTKDLSARRQQIFKSLGIVTGTGADVQQAKIEAYKQMQINRITTAIAAHAALSEYHHSSGPGGWRAAESAVAAKYYTHDTATSYPDQAVYAAMAAKKYIDQEAVSGKAGDSVGEATGDLMQLFFGGRSGR